MQAGLALLAAGCVALGLVPALCPALLAAGRPALSARPAGARRSRPRRSRPGATRRHLRPLAVARRWSAWCGRRWLVACGCSGRSRVRRVRRPGSAASRSSRACSTPRPRFAKPIAAHLPGPAAAGARASPRAGRRRRYFVGAVRYEARVHAALRAAAVYTPISRGCVRARRELRVAPERQRCGSTCPTCS